MEDVPKQASEKTTTDEAVVDVAVPESGESKKETSTDAGETLDKQGKPRPNRTVRPKKKGPPKDGIPSLTTIFVANLSYTCTQDKVCFFQWSINC